jgi:hypothetical protein
MNYYNLGPFSVSVGTHDLSRYIEIRIRRNFDGHVLFRTAEDRPFLQAAIGEVIGSPIHNGNFQAQESIFNLTSDLIVVEAGLSPNKGELHFTGSLIDSIGNRAVNFEIAFSLGTQDKLNLKVSSLSHI